MILENGTTKISVEKSKTILVTRENIVGPVRPLTSNGNTKKLALRLISNIVDNKENQNAPLQR